MIIPINVRKYSSAYTYTKIEKLRNKIILQQKHIEHLMNKLKKIDCLLENETKKNQKNLKDMDKIDELKLWNQINHNDLSYIESVIKFILIEYGTKMPCNRFDIGNSIELLISRCIESIGFHVDEYPNKKRIDIIINKTYPLSIKYSSNGDITLHNSNSSINHDTLFHDMLLLTPNRLYLITHKNLKDLDIKIENYLHNTGDSLKLKRSLLKYLDKINFKYSRSINIVIDKNTCKNNLCFREFFKIAMLKYNFHFVNNNGSS